MKCYKLFTYRNGRLYPLYVNASEALPMGVWMKATAGQKASDGVHVKSKLGSLAYRPGWHSCDLMPYASHIGKKDKATNTIKWQNDDAVWCECEYNGVSLQREARENGWRGGKWHAKYACLDRVPEDGWYRYKTNPNMTGDWIISGNLKIIRPLSQREVDALCRAAGHEPQPRTPEWLATHDPDWTPEVETA